MMNIKLILIVILLSIPFGIAIDISGTNNNKAINLEADAPAPLTNETILNTNSSDYWDNLDTPSDISTGDLTDDNTYVRIIGDTMAGALSLGNNNLNAVATGFFTTIGSAASKVTTIFVTTLLGTVVDVDILQADYVNVTNNITMGTGSSLRKYGIDTAGNHSWYNDTGQRVMTLDDNGSLSAVGQICDSTGCITTGDNSTWSQSLADTLYAPINYGDDWNKTYADELYFNKTSNYTKIFPLDIITRTAGFGSEDVFYGSDYDQDTDEYTTWQGIIPSDLVGNTVQFTFRWFPTVTQAGTNGVEWYGWYNTINDSGVLDTYTNTGNINVLLATNEPQDTFHKNNFTVIVSPGDVFAIRLYRDANHANDNATNDMFVGYDAYLEYTASHP